MKSGTVALLILGGVVLWSALSLGVSGTTAQVVLQGVQFNSLTDWVITLVVQNVSNGAIQVNSLNGQVIANGNVIGNLSDFSGAVLVPANSEQPINIHFTPSLLSIPATVQTLISTNDPSLKIEVKGYMNVNNDVLPYDETYNYGV